VRLTHDVVRVSALEDRAQFLADGNEDGDHEMSVKTVKEVGIVKR